MAFEVFLQQGGAPAAPRWRRRLTYAVSLSLHVGLLVVGAFQSLWRVDEISPRGVQVTFASAMAAPPAPPPPPPASARPVATARKPKPTPVPHATPSEVVQPREQPPEEPATTEGPDEGEAVGESGGSENGVAGGVIGGTAIEAPTPPPPRSVAPTPVMLAPAVGVGQRLSDLNDPRFRPTLPPVLNRPGNIVRGLFKICVGIDGHVTDVKRLKSADPAVDEDWANVIRRWEYKPFTINGHPTPFCHPLLLQVQSVN
jgi:hypothetical protein